MEEKDSKYVFKADEDVMKLSVDELKKYAKELQARLAKALDESKQYQNWWLADRQRVDAMKAAVEAVKKIANLMIEKW